MNYSSPVLYLRKAEVMVILRNTSGIVDKIGRTDTKSKRNGNGRLPGKARTVDMEAAIMD